jgi:hypothetical protein
VRARDRPLTQELAPDRTFVRIVLVDWLHVSEVRVGANFLRA